MNKFVDYIGLRLVLFFLVFVICRLCINSITTAIWLSVLIFFVMALIIELFAKQKRDVKCSFSHFVKHTALEGNLQLKQQIKQLLANYALISEGNEYIVIDNNGEQELIFLAFKFSAISIEDVAKCYRTSKELNIIQSYILGRDTNRQALSLLCNNQQKITFVSAKQLYLSLSKAGLLTATAKVKIKTINKFLTVLSAVFTRSNTKHFAFSGIVLALMSLITPLKIYYLTISLITLSLAFVCLLCPGQFYNNKTIFSTKKTKKVD